MTKKWYGWFTYPRSWRVALVLAASQGLLAYVHFDQHNYWLAVFFGFLAGINAEIVAQGGHDR